MKNNFPRNFLITVIVVLSIWSLPQLIDHRDFKTFNDNDLRKEALSRGMNSLPKTYPELLALVDTKENPLTPQKIHLGKELFFDTNLSQGGTISCMSCHMIKKEPTQGTTLLTHVTTPTPKDSNCVACHLEEESGTDRLSTSIGEKGVNHPFHVNTLSILNSSLSKYLTWSGDVTTLEEQVGISLLDKTQMNITEDEVVNRIKNNPKYVQQFATIYTNGNPISFENIKKSIAAYIKTLITRAPYDDFLDGDNNAMTAKAKRGLANFIGFGCKGCHTGITVGGQNLQKFPLKNLAEVWDFRVNIEFTPEFKIIDTRFPFENVGGYLGQKITKKFRVPILRNVTKTSPYFHNGSVDKLPETVALMGKHQLGLNLNPTQISEVVAFLKSLEGNIVDYSTTMPGGQHATH